MEWTIDDQVWKDLEYMGVHDKIPEDKWQMAYKLARRNRKIGDDKE